MYVNGLDFSSVSTIFLLDFGTAQTLLYPPLPILIIGHLLLVKWRVQLDIIFTKCIGICETFKKQNVDIDI
jgi:hypothetical protein